MTDEQLGSAELVRLHFATVFKLYSKFVVEYDPAAVDVVSPPGCAVIELYPRQGVDPEVSGNAIVAYFSYEKRPFRTVVPWLAVISITTPHSVCLFAHTPDVFRHGLRVV